jgi:hypothetical protein
MFLIAHRGNTEGPSSDEQENNPAYIQKALDEGYLCEVDVWISEIDGSVYLGHDNPYHKTDIDFLKNRHIICHAKNAYTLYKLTQTGLHCFSHVNDPYVLTSNGFLWTYPHNDAELTPNTICVMPEWVSVDPNVYPGKNVGIAGVCTDWPKRYQNLK